MIIQEEYPQEKSENIIHPQTENQKDEKDEEQSKEPPYPERFLVKKTETPTEYDSKTELKNFYIKIPLLQAIRDIPIYTKIIKDLYIEKPGQKRNKN